jgi:hypothetical protein
LEAGHFKKLHWAIGLQGHKRRGSLVQRNRLPNGSREIDFALIPLATGCSSTQKLDSETRSTEHLLRFGRYSDGGGDQERLEAATKASCVLMPDSNNATCESGAHGACRLVAFGPIPRTYPKISGDFRGNIPKQRSPPFSGPLSSDDAGDCETAENASSQEQCEVD